MEIIKNQTLYKCSYCGKRLLTKKGAKIHEERYCRHEDSPHEQAEKRKREECTHENTHEVWSYMAGEAVMEPDHLECLDCGEWLRGGD